MSLPEVDSSKSSPTTPHSFVFLSFFNRKLAWTAKALFATDNDIGIGGEDTRTSSGEKSTLRFSKLNFSRSFFHLFWHIISANDAKSRAEHAQNARNDPRQIFWCQNWVDISGQKIFFGQKCRRNYHIEIFVLGRFWHVERVQLAIWRHLH